MKKSSGKTSSNISLPPNALPFHVLAKPAGPQCNLDCDYCFYTYKTGSYHRDNRFKMDSDLLESYVRQYIESQANLAGDEITFLWQGGEPTLVGLAFYQQLVTMQQRYCPPHKKISNHIQTNGVLINEKWGAFLAENDFLVGLSLDGPQPIHDLYRKTLGRKGSFSQVMTALKILKKNNVRFNILTVVGRHNFRSGKEIYHFLKEVGAEHMQFIPLVERVLKPEYTNASATNSNVKNLDIQPSSQLAGPPTCESPIGQTTSWSVPSCGYGHFMNDIFDEWVHQDVGKVFVQLFDVQLGILLGEPASLCIFAPACGGAPVLEHNGDTYSCDHYVYEDNLLGNIQKTTLAELVSSQQQSDFELNKYRSLPQQCLRCPYLSACYGGCPKHRFLTTRKEREFGLNYLCKSYKLFFEHVSPYMMAMADLYRHGQAPAKITQMIYRSERGIGFRTQDKEANGRNSSCPCNSGKKFKKCCGSNAS